MTDTTPGGPPSTAEIAALTGRLRNLSNAAGADPVERARFLADKDALIKRITAGERLDADGLTGERGLTGGEGPPIDVGPALTAEEAARELAADGRPLDQARAVVRGYLDDVSEQVGTSVHLWGLDEADLAAIRADPIERARTAVAVLAAATENPAPASTEADRADDDGWSR